MTKKQKEAAEKQAKERQEENMRVLTDNPEKCNYSYFCSNHNMPIDDPAKQSGYLNWFDLETRTKKLVYELLQPSLTRQAEERDMLEKLQTRVKEKIEKRLGECEYILKIN